MKKEIIFDDELRKKWLSGAEKVAKAVGSTLGPCGRCFALTGTKTPIITKDGVSVAKDIELSDPVENSGAQLFKEMALKTNETVGDATTTTVILGYEMLKNGIKAIDAGCKPIELKRGMDKATEEAISFIKSRSREIKTQDEIKKVATVSANNDEKLGEIIAKAFETAGREGIVHAEISKDVNNDIVVSSGISFNKGWLSPYFINNKDKSEVNFEDALILLTDKKITMIDEIINFLNEAVQQKKPLLIICDELGGEALNAVIINILNGMLSVAAVECPGYGTSKLDWLEDISVMTGATLITSATGASLKDCNASFLGEAKTVKITKSETSIIGGKGGKKEIYDHVASLRKLKDEDPSKELDKRIARFVGSAVTIKVGASTDTEAKEIKDRVDDAICAVKAALDGGVSWGAGVNYACARENLIRQKNEKNLDKNRGYDIILEALKKPIYQLAENAGHNGEIVYNICLDGEEALAYDANIDDYVKADEIIEPTKAQIEALKNANSIVGMMLITNGANVKVEKEN